MKPELVLPASRRVGHRLWSGLKTGLINLLGLGAVGLYLLPLTYMVATAFKCDQQVLSADYLTPPWPARRLTYFYDGQERTLYDVPTAEGWRRLALVKPRPAYSEFIDPAHPEQGLIHWDGVWRRLRPVYEFYITPGNFGYILRQPSFYQALLNTFATAAAGVTGVLCSSVLVAYGFARFRIPLGHWLFILMIASIMIPETVTLIPTYVVFTRVFALDGTRWPILLPYCLGNPIMIFLLYQNLKGIPRDIDEAARLEGAGPFRRLISICLPQIKPALITVALLQFFYFWNETRYTSLYLARAPDLLPVSAWVQSYGAAFSLSVNLTQASALVVMAVPVIVLFLAQPYFLRGVRITGAEQ